jgi:hypothetical protein
MSDRFKFSKKPTKSAQRYLAHNPAMELESESKKKKAKKIQLPIEVSPKDSIAVSPPWDETKPTIEHIIDENGKWITD